MHYYTIPGLPREPKQLPTLDKILELTANYFNFDLGKLLSKKRDREIVDARCFFMYFCRHNYKFSLKQIAEILFQDHTTVIHGIRKIRNYIEVDEIFLTNYTLFEKTLKKII